MGSNWQQDTYNKTMRFAAEAHLRQTVTNGDLPYLTHVVLVTMEVIAVLNEETHPNGDVAVQCALLHDTIEDTPVTYKQIETAFGTAVADGVLALTKDETLRKADQMPDSLARIKQQPKDIWLVKLADRIINLGPPPSKWTVERINLYREEAHLIHTELHPASDYLAKRLLQKIADYPPK